MPALWRGVLFDRLRQELLFMYSVDLVQDKDFLFSLYVKLGFELKLAAEPIQITLGTFWLHVLFAVRQVLREHVRVNQSTLAMASRRLMLRLLLHFYSINRFYEICRR
jgi:hypothetical protein